MQIAIDTGMYGKEMSLKEAIIEIVEDGGEPRRVWLRYKLRRTPPVYGGGG